MFRMGILTISSVFFARSLTNDRAMSGIFSEAGAWPVGLTISFSENSLFGWDMMGDK